MIYTKSKNLYISFAGTNNYSTFSLSPISHISGTFLVVNWKLTHHRIVSSCWPNTLASSLSPPYYSPFPSFSERYVQVHLQWYPFLLLATVPVQQYPHPPLLVKLFPIKDKLDILYLQSIYHCAPALAVVNYIPIHPSPPWSSADVIVLSVNADKYDATSSHLTSNPHL